MIGLTSRVGPASDYDQSRPFGYPERDGKPSEGAWQYWIAPSNQGDVPKIEMIEMIEMTRTEPVLLHGASTAVKRPVCAATLAEMQCATTNKRGAFELEVETVRPAGETPGPATVKVMFTEAGDSWETTGWLVEADPGRTTRRHFDLSAAGA